MHSYSFSAGTKGKYLTNIRQGLLAASPTSAWSPELQRTVAVGRHFDRLKNFSKGSSRYLIIGGVDYEEYWVVQEGV